MTLHIGQLVRLKQNRGYHKAGTLFRVMSEYDKRHNGTIFTMQQENPHNPANYPVRVDWFDWRVEPVEERPLAEQIAELLG
jgi:hypothetical protein